MEPVLSLTDEYITDEELFGRSEEPMEIEEGEITPEPPSTPEIEEGELPPPPPSTPPFRKEKKRKHKHSRCGLCGGRGHSKSKCHYRRNTVICWSCGRSGHKRYHCPRERSKHRDAYMAKYYIQAMHQTRRPNNPWPYST